MNLTSASERGQLDERHIEDSLQLLAIRPPMGRWVDVGTGGGFPGLVLAAAEPDHAAHVTLVESNGKKAAFLRASVLAMGSHATVVAERAERVARREPPPNTVSARALASLADLFSMLEPWLSRGTVGLFPKGRRAEEEIEEAERHWRFECVRHPSATAPDAIVLEVTNLARARAGHD